jgi:ligand-binding sensor domain-containing protein
MKKPNSIYTITTQQLLLITNKPRMKYLIAYTLSFLFVFLSSCGQTQTKPTADDISKGDKSAPKPHQNSAGERAVSLAATAKVPVSMVRHIRLANNGDILIASYLGVFRYDGNTFHNLTSKMSPPLTSSFWDVLEDRKGNLWFGTRDSGVYHYDKQSQPAEQAGLPTGRAGFRQFTTEDVLTSNSVLHMYEDRAGNIWLGATRYDGKTPLTGNEGFRNFTTKDGFPSNSIRLLLEDKSGRLWFGAQGEDLFVFDASLPEGKKFTVLKNKDGKAFNNVWSVIEDSKGNFWFGDANGLWRYDGSTFKNVSQKGAGQIIQDKKGNIWTTGGEGPPRSGQLWSLSRYDAKSLYTDKPAVTTILSQPIMLLGILEDTKGNIWFGSGSGVFRYDGKTITDFKTAADRY